MKFNRISGYLGNPDIARPVIFSRLLTLLGQKNKARRQLIEFFEHYNAFASDANTGARRRNQILGDAAELLADLYIANSQTSHGLEFFQRLLSNNPGWERAYHPLSRLMFPGDNYILTLKALHKAIRPRFYVEIGVAQGASLSIALPSTDAVGVDPNPHFSPHETPNISVYAETSDAFFSAYEQRLQFVNRKIDMAFIDGLHLFEQALRDFINVEKRAANDGLIVLHDCIPFDEIDSARVGNTARWVGDIWKCLAILLDHRPDLNINIIGAAPSGLVLVRKLNPASRTLENDFDSLVKNYMPLHFVDWDRKYSKRIQIVPSHAEDIGLTYSRPLKAI